MSEAKSKKSKHIFTLMRIGVVAAGVIWAVHRISQEQRWSSFVEYLQRMNMWVFAGVLAIFTICHAIVGIRWCLLLRTQSIFIGYWAAVKLYFLGWFYNNFMPSSVGGDVVRAWYVTKHTDKRFEAALSVFVDRAIGLLSTLVIAGFFYMFFLRGKGLEITSKSQGGFLAFVEAYKRVLVWVILVIIVIFCGFIVSGTGRQRLKSACLLISLYGKKTVSKLINAAKIYFSKPLVIFAVFCLTIFVQILSITGFWFLGVNMGIDVSIKFYFVFFTLTWVLGALPVSIGGAVVIEGSLVILFTQFAGLEEPAAWAIALSQRAVWMITSLPGGVIHLAGIHLPKEFFVDSEEPIE